MLRRILLEDAPFDEAVGLHVAQRFRKHFLGDPGDAAAQFRLADGTMVRLTCSWRLQAGQEAVIEAAFYGTAGGGRLRNVGGSFYDFAAERLTGTRTERLTAGPDEWGGRAGADWARRLAAGERFSNEADQLVRVAEVLDAIYARSPAIAGDI